MANAKKSIVELLQEAKALKAKEAELKAQLKAQKKTIALEYQDSLNPETKAQQIAEAEKILNTATQKAQALRMEFKNAMRKIKSEVSFAKEILSFVNYKQGASLGKVKNQMVIDKNNLIFNREGLKEIRIDISKTGWEKTFKEALKLQGINGQDRIADNLVYKAQLMIKGEAIETEVK